ncbi:MAG TPA: hypothetical protein VGI93_23750 [Steroidobacteraceae bacterium]
MDRPEYNLFPLILGVALASAGAFGWYLAVETKRVPSLPVAPPPRMASASPVETPAGVTPTAQARQTSHPPVLASEASPSLAESPAAAVNAGDPAPASPKIWQCDIDGRRVYADFQCGSDAKPAELSAINRMSAAPVSPRRYSYPSAPAADYAPDDYDGGDAGANSTPAYEPYPVVYAVRPRSMHPHRPPQRRPAHHGER